MIIQKMKWIEKIMRFSIHHGAELILHRAKHIPPVVSYGGSQGQYYQTRGQG